MQIETVSKNNNSKTPQKNVYEVVVAGLPLKIRSSHDELTVMTLVQMINSKVDHALSANAQVSFQNALVLAALNIAEELMLLKKTTAEQLDQIEGRTRNILENIEDLAHSSNS